MKKDKPPYIHPDGSILPSVNQILDTTTETPSKTFTPSEEKKRQERMYRGSCCHAAIADLLSGTTPTIDEIILPWWGSICGFVGGVVQSEAKILLSEQPLIHPVLRYGGTPDLVLSWDGKTTALIDLKSTEGTWSYDPETKNRSYTPYWNEYRKLEPSEIPPRFLTWDNANPYLKRAFLQATFYKMLTEYHDISISEIWIVVLTKAQYQIIHLPSNLWNECYGEAIARLKKFNTQQLENIVA
ncbi:hypothetical protein [Gloeothece verrucosa]|uniref:PD-(D/E)XK endonuclease-like domain-containing protein n=1 Tax=Gloeothece verrucosa (strain PCC 7822) TaxID=497965 RepID=E0UNL6_GLOV7|nr:hypothetical protein [Gloeothece verrucosa]ADN18546.1 hypothetical protein Cyan7822_6902 [Gloeothece verrucosa PCC 7822]